MRAYILRWKSAQGTEVLSISRDFHTIVREYHMALENHVSPSLYIVDLEALTIQQVDKEEKEIR